MGHARNAKIVKASRMLVSMTINDDNIIINNNFNSFMDGLDNKSLEKEKKNKNTNMVMIT